MGATDDQKLNVQWWFIIGSNTESKHVISSSFMSMRWPGGTCILPAAISFTIYYAAAAGDKMSPVSDYSRGRKSVDLNRLLGVTEKGSHTVATTTVTTYYVRSHSFCKYLNTKFLHGLAATVHLKKNIRPKQSTCSPAFRRDTKLCANGSKNLRPTWHFAIAFRLLTCYRSKTVHGCTLFENVQMLKQLKCNR